MKRDLFVKDKDLRLLWLVLAGALLVCVKLVLCSAQRMYVEPEGAVLDDMLAYNTAVNIANGEWLGPYNYLTLSKHSFFSLWLAVLHWLGVPYLAGGQLLWAAGSAAAAWAVAPALKKRWLSLALFAALLFSPSSTANPEPFGFVLRVYRDNIFPALCVLCIAGMVGYALRYGEKLRRSVGWLALAGLALGACWLTREDGWWLLPFVVAAAVITFIFILRGDRQARARRCAALLLPFVLLGACTAAWSGMNYRYYGRFILSDFSSGEFADAYGAMTRIKHENWDPQVAVPYDVRQQLYEHVPAFAELRPILEEDDEFRGQYVAEGGDYDSGGFYWALREAAAMRGYYDTPQKAQEYFAGLARDINALCDEGVLAAGPARSSVSPPIRGEYVGPVVGEGFTSLWYCATFQDCDARSMFSPHSNDPGMYEALVRPMEEFLHDTAQTMTVENSDAPYFTPRENQYYMVLDVIRYLYMALLPLGLLAALAWQVLAGVQLVKRLKKRERDPAATLLWLVQLGLLGCFMLRAFMVAFVSVSSFRIGTYVMYLASIHPLMLLYAFIGVVSLWRLLRGKRAAARGGEG